MICLKVLCLVLMINYGANAAPISDAAPESDPQVVNVVRTHAPVAPLTQVRVIPVDATHQVSHLSHAPVATVQTLRTVPSHQTVQELRTIPATHAVQSLRTVPAVVRHDATHVVHTAPAQTVQAVRTVPAQTIVHTNPVPVRTAVVSQPAEALGVAQYSFGYSIADTETGDSKSRQETRNGDVTTGSYSVADPDGRIRTVTYTADAVNGFQAQVTYDGEAGPPAIAINGPETANIVASSSPSVVSVGRNQAVVSNTEAVIEDERASLFENSVPVTTPVQQVVRTVPTVVRSNAAHVVHTSPVTNIQTVRAVPTLVRSDATHVVHNAPVQTVHTIPHTVRAVSSPTASHIVHHSDHSTPTATILRSVSPNVVQFQTATGIRSVPVIGVGSNQFLRAVNTLPLSTAQFVHA